MSDRRLPYWVGYGLTAGGLLVLTGVLVLVVLPSRYALVADLREAGVSFPTSPDAVPFEMPRRETLVEPPPDPVPREPGPAESLWAAVDSLRAAGAEAAALERMDRYLAEYPDDVAVRRERARTLVAVDRPVAARAAYEDLAKRPGAAADRLALARLLRDAGEIDAAAGVYRGLLADRPDDSEVRYELARLYLWNGRYGDAERVLRGLVTDAPTDGRFVLALARALYWDDRAAEALETLADVPVGGPESAEAADLRAELERLLAPPPGDADDPPSLAERARGAMAAGDLRRAGELYRAAVEAAPSDTSLAREWVDFLQFRLEDQEAAIAALEAQDRRFGLQRDGRFRLARLYAWTGRLDEAREVLQAMLADDEDDPPAWALLGDVYRYDDAPSEARRAYERARGLDPDQPQALAGIAELDRLREATIAARARPGVGPRASLFGDSDDFLLLDLGVGGGWVDAPFSFDAEAGYRRLEGSGLGGAPADDRGVFALLAGSYWWAEATLRTTARLGVDMLDAAGTEPVFGVSAERFDRAGGSLAVRYDHGPAYPLTLTLESALAQLTSDRLQLAVSRAVGPAWSLAASVEAARIAGADAANTRWAGGARVSRSIAPWAAVDVGTGILGFSEPAPAAFRRLYWDPRLFWASTAGVTLGSERAEGLGVRLRLSAGAALADERDGVDARWIPQYGAEAAATWRRGSTEIEASTFYRRGREDEYNSYGAELALRVRP